ncbi:nuclear factor of activated T-cells, cytoplasmic 1-like protein [Lates japonicus]|uniref:Nuclear factor of activated T-cells, cytoplasmic 1-like protein n=1 Tax=Lates japonicus TaxID=270547 RepID=A0AAD3MSV2_LATJO|nr:nuclear factor of activated T-cells, cytoplasmic 1-like protein [Lates japonicus]
MNFEGGTSTPTSPASVPTIKTEPHDDYDAPLMCTQHGSTLSLHPKPFFPPQVMTPMMTSDLRPCVVGGAYPVSQQRLAAKPSSLPSSSSPSTSPKLHDLSPPPFSKCLPAGPAVPHQGPQSPIPHVSIIQETPGRYQLPSLYPPSSSSSSPTSQPSTPTDAPFSPTHCMTPAQPVSGSTSPVAQQHPKMPERGRPSLQEDGSPPTLAVSIKQEPQELDQMYLDDVNEIIRNDLSSISVHSHA